MVNNLQHFLKKDPLKEGKTMKNTKNWLLLLFFILAAVVVGALLGGLAQDISWLNWLTEGARISFGNVAGNAQPLLDLSIVKLNFGFEMSLNILQIILITIALVLYRKFRF